MSGVRITRRKIFLPSPAAVCAALSPEILSGFGLEKALPREKTRKAW